MSADIVHRLTLWAAKQPRAADSEIVIHTRLKEDATGNLVPLDKE